MMPVSSQEAGFLLIILSTVVYGGIAILRLLIFDPRHTQNRLRQDFWRAGHAHAGVILILSLVALLYVDQANLSDWWKGVVRICIPTAAALLPLGFVLSMLLPEPTRPNKFYYLTYLGATLLTIGLVVLGVGLLST
jgi:drug/metabolite transporter superfamily protein YnfA